MTATIRRSQDGRPSQKEPTSQPAAANSQGREVGTHKCNGDCNGDSDSGNAGEWEPSEVDDQRWAIAPLLNLGEISSEARPEPAGGALMALAHDLKAEALGRPARALPRFATFAPWDADVRDEQRADEAADVAAARKKQKLRAYRDRQQMAKHRFRRIEKMMREHRSCADCRKRMDMHGIFANRPVLARRECLDVLVCRDCEDRATAAERNGAA
ncbi:MAG TPA: hypothetical protein VFG04_08110 [Planctomycetaceae bacterium]|jgi:hypothetical protein|nr:hypothetical protein [Planctomycetaceae bacterium]